MCDRAITIEEINTGIHNLKINKSPGNDGLTSEFYKHFKDGLSEFLLCMFKEAIENGKLPPTMCQGLISLIPKPNKDILKIENWRPITLLNNDVKILSSMFSQRLK